MRRADYFDNSRQIATYLSQILLILQDKLPNNKVFLLIFKILKHISFSASDKLWNTEVCLF